MDKRIFSCKFVFLGLALTLLSAIMTSAAADPVHGSVSFVEVKHDTNSTESASVVEVSPDGKYLYVGSIWGSITVFKRNAGTGRLIMKQYIQDDDFGLAGGLFGISDIIISPDGSHLYACLNSSASAVLIFDRSNTNGTLSYTGRKQDGVGGVYGLLGSISMVITPDGSYIYVAANADSAIARFKRNSTSGALAFLGVVEDGSGSVQHIGGVYDLAMSPDGKHLYAVADTDDAITSFQVSNLTGNLSYVNHQTGLGGARGVTVSPDGNYIYVAEADHNSITNFSRNSTSGAVDTSGFGLVVSGSILDGARDVVVSPDGQHVYVIAYSSHTIVSFWKNPAENPLNVIGYIMGSQSSAGLNFPWQLAISPDGGFIYVASNSGDAVAILRRDENTGNLKYIHTEECLPFLMGPVGVAVSQDGRNVYVASNVGNSLNVLRRDLASGKLQKMQTFWDGYEGVNGLAGARAVAISPDDKHVYVAGHSDNGIAIFSRTTATGHLLYDGVVLNSDPGVSGLGGIQSLTVSPTGGYVYAASIGDDALAVFSRNSSTGALTFVKSFLDSNPAYDGLDDATHVAISSDCKHVYVAGYTDDSVSHFEWLEAGGLTYRSTIKDGVPSSIDGLNGANSIVISPNGNRLYVAGRNDDAIAMFIRGTTSGLLGYHSMIKNGVGGVYGLNGVRAITMNSSGTYVYAASQVDDALAVFSRDTTYGDLTYFTAIYDSDPGIDGLNTANGIAISPMSNHIYVAAYDDDAVSVFAHSWGIYVPMVVRE